MTPARNRASESASSRLLKRAGLVAGALLVLWFAVEGGEYGTTDLFSQQGRRARLEAEVAALRAEVDSLKGELESVSTDPVRLERIARELYGMVKSDKEIVYWTNTPRDGAAADSARDAAGSGAANVSPDTSGVR